MRLRPARVNAVIACLFIAGSACFVLGSVPAYANAVGGSVDAITYFVGSIFFTVASFGQLVQAQSPGMSAPEGRGPEHERGPVRWWAWLPHDRDWLAAAFQFPGTLAFNVSTLVAVAHNLTARQEDKHIWRPDVVGSTLFVVASVIGIIAVGGGFRGLHHSQPWRIAWLNMVGSAFFMGSAVASFVLPSTGELIDAPVAVAGTFLGGVCFLGGAALMLPVRRDARLEPSARTQPSPKETT